MSKIDEYRRKLQEYEEKVEEEAKLFNIDEFLEKTYVVREKKVEGLGIVRYKRLSYAEYVQLVEKHRDDSLKLSLAITALMLSKADPNVTIEKLEMLPPEALTVLVKSLMEEATRGFLSQGIGSQHGLNGTQPSRQSAP